LTSPYYEDILRQTVEAVYRAALLEFERLRRLGPEFASPNKEMTASEAKLHLRFVRYLQAHAMREEGKTLAEIGRLFGVSRQRVNQLLSPPAEMKKPGRPKRRAVATNSPPLPETLMMPAAYRYRLQVRDKFTYLDDAFEIGFLVNALLDSSRQVGVPFVKNRFVGPVSLSDISITLSTIDPAAVERVWYSSEPNGIRYAQAGERAEKRAAESSGADAGSATDDAKSGSLSV
jgi:hypothetical protein